MKKNNYDFEPIISSEDFKRNQQKIREENIIKKKIAFKEKILLIAQLLFFAIASIIIFLLIETI